jgi:hypothetical protein
MNGTVVNVKKSHPSLASPCYRRRSTNPPTWKTDVEVLVHFSEVMRRCTVLLEVKAFFLVVYHHQVKGNVRKTAMLLFYIKIIPQQKNFKDLLP